jgi:hypothetical protein
VRVDTIKGDLAKIIEAARASAHARSLEVIVVDAWAGPDTNSFFWVRDGKDSLALGNITGAMVFQSTLPVAIGLGFTNWELGSYAILAGCLALALRS